MVRRFDYDCYAKRLEHAVKTGGDFSGHLFLNLKPLGIDIDKSGKLGDTNHPFAWKIANVGSTDNWSEVMLAM